MKQSLTAAKQKLEAENSSSNELSTTGDDADAAGGAGLGGIPGLGGLGGAGGLDFASMLSNPNFMNMGKE